MASAFGHAAAGAAITYSFFALTKKLPGWFYLLAIALAILPDADVIGFKFGIPYESVWGHRGASHSIYYAVLVSIATAAALSKFRQQFQISFTRLTVCLTCVTFSHALLDAMTSGGLGAGFFAPFSSERYFFDFHPILVSPIGVKQFFSARGLEILASEALWIGIPSNILVAVITLIKRAKAPTD